MNLTIDIMREDWADTHVPLPSYASAGAVGADLRANLSEEDRGGRDHAGTCGRDKSFPRGCAWPSRKDMKCRSDRDRVLP